MKKPGISLDRHIAIGAEIKRTIEFLENLQIEVRASLPSKQGNALKSDIASAMKRLDVLRSAMESALADEHRAWDVSVYYGPSGEAAA